MIHNYQKQIISSTIEDHRSSDLSERENYDLLGINGTKNINSEWIEPLVKGNMIFIHIIVNRKEFKSNNE